MVSLITRKHGAPFWPRLVPLAAIAVVAVCTASYLIALRNVQPTWEELPRAIVRRVSFDSCLTASGVAQSPQQTVVKCQLENLRIRSRGGAFLTGGASTILEIIPNGATVKKGDVLCRLDASEYEEVALAQTIRVEQHKAEDVQRDTASLIELGATVRQGQELFYFPDLSKMEVVAMLNEAVVDRVRSGLLARVRFEGSRETAYDGRVLSVDVLPRRSANDVPYYPCRIALETTPPGLLPGMSAEVEVQVGRRRDVLAVPGEAVSVDHNRNVCYVIGPSGLLRREITTGKSTPEVIEVTDGLKEGDSVVLDPARVFDRFAWPADAEGPAQNDTAALAAIH